MSERIHKARGIESNFVMLRNHEAQRCDLSYEALGMLVYLMSLPSDWIIKVESLQRENHARRDKVKRILSELRDAGYLELTQEQDESGRFSGSTYHAYAIPKEDRESDYPAAGLSDSRETSAYKEISSAKEKGQKKRANAPTARVAKIQSIDANINKIAKGIIKAWMDTTKAVGANLYAYHMADAITLADAGIAYFDVLGFCKLKLQDEFYRDKPLSFAVVAKSIVRWKASYEPPKEYERSPLLESLSPEHPTDYYESLESETPPEAG